MEGFEPRQNDFATGLLVLCFQKPISPAQEVQLRMELQRESITREEEADDDDETEMLAPTCFVTLPWNPPEAHDASRHQAALQQIATKFGANDIHCLQVGTALHLPDQDQDDDDDDDDDADEPDEGGWRAGPPPQADDVSFPLENAAERREQFDYEDWGVAVKLAGEKLPGELRLLRAMHKFWLAPYFDPEKPDVVPFRHANMTFDPMRRAALLWVDRFFVPAAPNELVGHLTWILVRLSAILAITHARFDGANMTIKYAGLQEDPEPPFVLAGNPLRAVLERGEDPRAWSQSGAPQRGWTPREIGAMAAELVYEVDPDDQPEQALRLIDLGLEFDRESADLARCKFEVLLRHARVDEVLAAVRRHRDVKVHFGQLAPLLRKDRLDALRRLVGVIDRLDANEASLVERLPRFVDVAPELLVPLLKKLPERDELVPGLHSVAHSLGERGDDASKDAAFAIFEAIFARSLPEEGTAARENFLSAWNNACVQAHASKRFALAAEIADRAQPFVPENPFITHAAACAYVAVGALDKALEQVRLAIELDYQHLAQLEKDTDLGPLLERAELKALFAARRSAKAANRPAGVPEGAAWSESENEWVLAPKDEHGRDHGLVRYFRPDGSLVCETEHQHGVPHGAFRRFHESGEVSREGTFERGKLRGTNTFFRSEKPTTENFPNGLDEHVWRAEMDFADDQIVAARAFDRRGNRIREDGSPMPDRPEGVSEDAHFGTENGEDRWLSGHSTTQGERSGTWRIWASDGTLLREATYRHGKRNGLERTWDVDTGIARAQSFVDDRPVSELTENFPEGMMRDPRIRVARGPGDERSKRGVWSFEDQEGAFLLSVDLGVEGDADAFEPIVDDRRRHPGEWRALADGFARRRDFAAALGAMARGLGSGADLAAMMPILSAHAIPLGGDARARRTELLEATLEEECGRLGRLGSAKLALHGVLEGADVASAFRAVARILDDHFDAPRAASDFIRAAMALAPHRHDFEQTRALIELSQGRPDEADRAITKLREHDEKLAVTLTSYRAYLYPRYEFWPARDAAAQWVLEHGEPDDVPVRDTTSIVAIVQESATRIALLRDALATLVGEPSWLAPAPRPLLPNGPVRVRKAVVDAIFLDEPPQPAPLAHPQEEFADTFGFSETERISVLHVQRALRTEWAILGWLCFVAGIDRIGLPPTGPGAQKPRAIRALLDALAARHDVIVDRANGDTPEVDGVLAEAMAESDWYGQRVLELDAANAEFALKEHKRLLHALEWLTDEERASPWDSEPQGSSAD